MRGVEWPLITAVECNWLPRAKFFLEHKDNPNAGDGAIIFVIACHGSAEMAQSLLDHETKPPADATVIDARNYCLVNIIYAAYTGNSWLLAQKLAGSR